MLHIMLKMIIQEVGSKVELPTRKYKPMMMLDNKIPANWANYIYFCLLNNIKRCDATKRKTLEVNNDVYFRLLISFLLEKNILIVDQGAQLADSDFIPCSKKRSKQIKIILPLRIPHQLTPTSPTERVAEKEGTVEEQGGVGNGSEERWN